MHIETSRGNLPVKYTWNTLADFGDMANMSMNDVLKMDPSKLKISQLMDFIYCGFKWGAKYAEEEPKVKSREDVGDLMTDDVSLVRKCLEAFTEFVGKTEQSLDKKK